MQFEESLSNHIIDYSQVEEFFHQIAGHTNEKVRRYRAVDQTECILKPRNKVDLFVREVNFYEDIYRSNIQEQIAYLAKYFGVVDLTQSNSDGTGSCGSSSNTGGLGSGSGSSRCSSEGGNSPHDLSSSHHSQSGSSSSSYHQSHHVHTHHSSPTTVTKLPHIVLSDLTFGYKRPCVIDLKMGRQSYEPSASREKKERVYKKYPYQSEIGFRITGLKVWDEDQQAYHTKSKSFGRSILPDQVTQALAFFFQNGLHIRVDIIRHLLGRLQGLLKWMKIQKRYKFYCSSILVVYDGEIPLPGIGGGDCDEDVDGHTDNGSQDESEEGTTTSQDNPTYSSASDDLCRFAMIDFAHVVASDEVDADYVYGLENLISKLKEIIDIATNSDHYGVEALMTLARACIAK